ncbi:hypothetical protein [Micromonospora sp. RTP1Z1]|uniref:hypothetical protein n=1 Tax=Micromonospora sp. RTP1Z1 TaxID=2994043 RepID=UPI0029C7FCA3|nr:hypothetical protein [Micromonospora sp. RTP1Z1]
MALMLLTSGMLLSSCTVPVDGLAGVTVDEKGNPIGVVRTCEHPLDGATLYWPDDPRGSDGQPAELGQWEFTGSTVTHSLAWPLGAASAADVKGKQTPQAMLPGRTFSLYGWTTDNSWSAANVDFTLTDLEGLPVGKILVLDSGTRLRVVSEPEFDALVCE